MTPIGKRIFILLINLALGESGPKITFEWLTDKNIITGSKYDQRRVQQIIHHWKISSGEIFQNYTNCNHNQIKEFKSPELRHSPNTKFLQSSLLNVPSVHEGKKSFKCKFRPAYFTQKANLTKHMRSEHVGKNELLSCNTCKKSLMQNEHMIQHICDSNFDDR